MVLSVVEFFVVLSYLISFDLNLDVFIQLSILKYNLGKSCIKSLQVIMLLCKNP